MELSGEDTSTLRAAIFVPVELRDRGLHKNPIFRELNRRALSPATDGIRIIHPWIRWQDFSACLDCIAFADRSARELPAGRGLNMSHATPGRLYSVSCVFVAHQLIGNIAEWLCEAMPLAVAAPGRTFVSEAFQRELVRIAPPASELLARHSRFIREIAGYHSTWMRTIHAGSVPMAGGTRFESPEAADRFPGVPRDPTARATQGGPNYQLGEFTAKIFEESAAFYLTWLRFALDYVE